MKSIVTIFFLILGTLGLQAQEGNLEYIKAIAVEVNKHNQIYYRHTLKPKETLYSLSRYFNIPIEDLLLVNKLSSGDIVSVGTQIVIPIDKSLLRTPIKKANDDWVPLIYTVEKQETLFKISHSYFPQPIQNLSSRNKINSFSLNAGRNLVIGWWGSPESVKVTAEDFATAKRANNRKAQEEPDPQKETEEEAPNSSKKEGSIVDLIRNKIIKRANQDASESIEETSSPQSTVTEDEIVATQDTIISDLVVIDTVETEPIEEPVINYQSGIATWDKEGFDRENLFVMHNDAKPNSYIRLRHPVTKMEVTALVLAGIPKGVHSSEVDIVLSPAVALALGALNSKFKIEMDYYQ